MSVARKRAKVKKKSKLPAVRGKRKKRVAKASRARTKKKRPAQPTKRPKEKPKAKKKRVSVNTKRKRLPPPQKPKKRKKKARPRPRKKKPILQQIAERFEVPERIVTLTAFLQVPEVAEQIRDRIIEKGLAELRRGMVQTKESVIIGHLIIAEQLGNFDQRANELAAEYDMPVREIYSLWLSPPMGEAAA